MYQEYPFAVEYKSPIGQDSVTFSNINPAKYGIIYSWASKSISTKVYAIAYYKDGSSKEMFSDIMVKQNTNGELDGDLLYDIFGLNGTLIPEYIEFIITPFKCAPFKWMINIEEG